MNKLLLLLCLAPGSIMAQTLNVTTFGAVGNGSTINTTFIQAAVDSCSRAGGGIVEFPSGNFMTGTVFLKSNVTIQIDAGATITGSSSLSDYPDVTPLIRSYADHYPSHSVFYAEGQHNIAVVGPGTFNGNGLSLSFLTSASKKPYGFRFISCSNIRYENLQLRNSGFWMMHNQDCDTMLISNLNIINHAYGNNDGIDIDGCRNVIVDSCYADCNDDALVLKTTSLIACSNVEVKNSTFATYSRAIKLGTESSGPFSNIHIHDCVVQYSTHGPFGSSNAGKCGINLGVVDGGSIAHVLINNISMTGINTPICIRLGNRGNKYTDTASTPGVGFMQDVELNNIAGTASSDTTSTITGIPGYYAENIRLKNIDISYPGGWGAISSSFVVPENISAGPEATLFGDTLPAGGLYMRHVDSLLLQNVCFYALRPDGRPTIIYDDVLNLDTSNVCYTSPSAVKEISQLQSIQIYPNPATSSIQIYGNASLAGAEVQITDTRGELLLSDILADQQHTVSVASLSAGIYYLQISKDGQLSSFKLVKL